jgi:hypothetical protein
VLTPPPLPPSSRTSPPRKSLDLLSPPVLPLLPGRHKQKTSMARLVAAGSSSGLLRPPSSLLLYKAAAPWDGGVVRVYSSDEATTSLLRGASASSSSTRRRRPSTSRLPRWPRSTAPCSAADPEVCKTLTSPPAVQLLLPVRTDYPIGHPSCLSGGCLLHAC